jgi:serine/threonine-protein kinase
VSGGQAFFISFLTAAIVSVGINVGFKLAAEKATPEPVAPVVEEPKEVTVPNLTGLSLAAAKARVQQVGLVAGEVVEEESDKVPRGEVIGSIPERFTQLREGLIVKIKVSAGITEIDVPDVKRKHPRKARKMLEDAGFVVEQKNILNEDFPFDRVVRQEPEGGGKAAPGSTVIITVNTEEENY